ncbi:reverse transcriptase N-terminal domain-containing protein [Herbivorax sp. ANBcel31]|uniref:reverse transcriptase N-terminal domain-containing protein n=1 Tax=Herbivorax sp. ANBcel31 TaxID=3069754 RepID=UPI0027B58EC0|nr:reverse transcriptase N-terminal domain-containing protein [Herbivorax sp. ANBcel31]MDQ2085734.1 reverse transcriptase N-terminal domain-containing protein [Herbivorax sp. ANBcel31]
MNIEKPKRVNRASIDYDLEWNSIDWNSIEAKVNKLQSRIAKAAKSLLIMDSD